MQGIAYYRPFPYPLIKTEPQSAPPLQTLPSSKSTADEALVLAQQELEAGFTPLSGEVIEKLQRVAEQMIKHYGRYTDSDVTYLTHPNRFAVFRLKEVPHLVFKLCVNPPPSQDGNELTEARYANMIRGKQVCMNRHYEHLVMPQAKKIEVQTATCRKVVLIEEQFLKLNEDTVQEEQYRSEGQRMNTALEELADFIAATGFNDVTPRNMPILQERPGYRGPMRLGLIDLENMENVSEGFSGSGNGSGGLIGCCTTKEQVDLVMELAQKHGVVCERLERREKKQLKQLENDRFKITP